mmetsp:Transcript_77222/g.136145  ORF Transcript_77222/g.136145 Transcript_77222/m.136145 type:complete len:203 (-) Transcript_77222:1215-1823(-)
MGGLGDCLASCIKHIRFHLQTDALVTMEIEVQCAQHCGWGQWERHGKVGDHTLQNRGVLGPGQPSQHAPNVARLSNAGDRGGSVGHESFQQGSHTLPVLDLDPLTDGGGHILPRHGLRRLDVQQGHMVLGHDVGDEVGCLRCWAACQHDVHHLFDGDLEAPDEGHDVLDGELEVLCQVCNPKWKGLEDAGHLPPLQSCTCHD